MEITTAEEILRFLPLFFGVVGEFGITALPELITSTAVSLPPHPRPALRGYLKECGIEPAIAGRCGMPSATKPIPPSAFATMPEGEETAGGLLSAPKFLGGSKLRQNNTEAKISEGYAGPGVTAIGRAAEQSFMVPAATAHHA